VCDLIFKWRNPLLDPVSRFHLRNLARPWRHPAGEPDKAGAGAEQRCRQRPAGPEAERAGHGPAGSAMADFAAASFSRYRSILRFAFSIRVRARLAILIIALLSYGEPRPLPAR